MMDDLLDDLTDLAASGPPATEFFAAVLAAATKSTNAIAGAVWSAVDGSFRLEQQVGLVALGLGNDPALQRMHEEALAQASLQLEQTIDSIAERQFSSMRFQFYACHGQSHGRVIIELVHAADSKDDIDFQSRLMSAIGEIAGDFRNSQLLNQLQLSYRGWQYLQSVLPRLHAGIGLDETAFRIANEGRHFLECDRFTVARWSRGRTAILAVSSVAVLERRAKQIRALELLIATVVKSGAPLHYPSKPEELPQRELLLQDYLDSVGCEQITILPVHKMTLHVEQTSRVDKEPLGAFVIESFSCTGRNEPDQQGALFIQQAGLAFQNACEFADLPLLAVSLWLRSFPKGLQSRGVKLLTGCMLAAGAILVTLLIPATLTIEAKGTFEPQQVRHIYAPVNGEIEQVRAEHQGRVEIGQPLIIMRSRELELRKEELMSQRGVTLEKLRSIEAARLRERKTTNVDSASAAELSASVLELKEVLASQEGQLAILEQMLAELELKSPLAGSVISWNPTESLERRPVQQGQKLISIAELDGHGRLQLRVLDTDLRHVVAAQAASASSLQATFTIASDPGRKHTAAVRQVGTLVETLNQDGATVRVEAVVESNVLHSARPGATVVAKINCGRSNLGYVWTRRLIDFIWLRLI